MDLAPGIVVTGPESSGKSALAEALAEHFKGTVVPEFARTYLEKHGPQYSLADFKHMLAGQWQRNQNACADARGPVFLDTDVINFAVWADFVYKKRPEELQALLAQPNSHCYLLCYPDLPWEPDALRVNPRQRLKIFEAHKRLIQEKNRPFATVKGTGSTRFQNALSAVKNWL
jgi:NadR type nicotinamide-nucleotide adenylyltransferase